MRGSQNGCHFYFRRMAVLVAVRFVATRKYFLASAPAGARARADAGIRGLKFVQPAMTRFSNHPGKEASLLTKIRRLLRGVTACKPNSSQTWISAKGCRQMSSCPSQVPVPWPGAPKFHYIDLRHAPNDVHSSSPGASA
jgi:hypothetical protein